MKSLLLLLLFLPNPACTTTKNSSTGETIVYLCGSGKGEKYHLNSNCRGLSNCQYKTIKTTLKKAKKDGKTLCLWED